MGVGRSSGKNKAEEAAHLAISSPLLETSIAGAHGVIINITSSPDIGLEDVELAASQITNSTHPDANIIWGASFDESITDEIRITVVATGFESVVNSAELQNNTPTSRIDIPLEFSNTKPVAEEVVVAPAPVEETKVVDATPELDKQVEIELKKAEEEKEDTDYFEDIIALLNNR